MKNASVAAPVILLALAVSSLKAQTWQLATGDGPWITNTNWSPQTVPNSVGAATAFNAPTGTRTVTLGDGNSFTVGSISLINASSFTTTIRNDASNTGGAASLTFDAADSGPATVTVDTSGTTTNQSLITADMVFADTVDFNVLATTGNSSAGALSVTGNITGPGGLIKDGVGEMTTAFVSGQASQVKNYQGATVINNGRWRHSVGGTPTMTSSVTVNNGGQIDLISNVMTYTYGASSATPLNLNGFGPTSGPFAAFPGAIRPDTNLVITVANNTVLQSDSMLHMEGSASGALTMSGNMSGKGILYAGSIPHDANVGRIVLSGSNSYTGGSIVNVGTLEADPASTNAFGTGTVQVVSANLAFAGSQAHIHIDSGATDAIANTAFLNLAGGGAAATADDGYADLDSGVNETVAGLMLGGTIIPAGQYGSSSSGATGNATLTGMGINPDEFFAGLGTIINAATGVPGDYNNNGVVDAADYVLWRQGGPLANDFTPGVQASDYSFWRSRFGASTNPGSGSGSGSAVHNAAVPEPTSIVLACLVVGLLSLNSRRQFAEIA